jgi:TonB dependent receptor-like, beta-barrel/Carboxypeptidase regulatory-like domain/TonB-dependent Receptor Plug Domain
MDGPFDYLRNGAAARRFGGQANVLAALWGLILLTLFAPARVFAADVGSVHGIVHDPQHLPIAHADVTLRSATSGWQQHTKTDEQGAFAFATVPLGDYVLSVAESGFTTMAQAATVTSSSSPIAHVMLVPGPTLPTLTVTAAVESAAVSSATPTTLVNRQDIDRTPGASRSNSLAMITNFVPGAYFVHDQLHIRGGHQTTWAIDGVEIPNTNIASNLGPQIDPKDIDYLEVQRGSYQADQGDRTYGVFNVVPRTGFERDNQGELIVSGGNFGQTNDYLSFGGHTERSAYYGSVDGNRSDLGIQTPGPDIIHDREDGFGGFTTYIVNTSPEDQIRFVGSVRRDDYQIPNNTGDMLRDIQREADAFAIASWVHKFDSETVLTSSLLYHLNRADLDGGPGDFPISTTAQRSSTYLGGQENLAFHAGRNEAQVGILGFSQHDAAFFNVLFNDGSNAPVNQRLSPSGNQVAAFVEDTFKATHWLTLTAGVRQTHFEGGVVENATSPRLGVTILLPRLNWTVRGFYGKFYQAPPLTTLSGPLLAFAQNSNLSFLPLHGERDKEYQFGVSIPLEGWTIDIDHFRTEANNFFDHNPIGNSNVFLPITIEGALIRGSELAVRSPRVWEVAQVHLAYSNQTADGRGAINGGLTNFSPPPGYFQLDHDQRNTANAGLDVNLPWQSFASMNLYSGSGFSNGAGPPSHLPSHTQVDLSFGKTFSQSCSGSVTVLNLTNRRLLLDNSLTFGGFHYSEPREIYAQIHYKFGSRRSP